MFASAMAFPPKKCHRMLSPETTRICSAKMQTSPYATHMQIATSTLTGVSNPRVATDDIIGATGLLAACRAELKSSSHNN